MNADELRVKLATSQEHLEAALTAKQNAEHLSAAARDLGGGIPGFGGSGNQRAATQVRGAHSRADRAHREADERVELWTGKIRSLERRIAELERVRFTADDLKTATHVKTDIRWYKVTRVNKASVTVEMPPGWDNRFPIERITEWREVAS